MADTIEINDDQQVEEVEKMLTETRDRVKGYLQNVFPDFVEFSDGSFTVSEGSAIISIIIRPWYGGDVAVEFTSHLVSGANLTPEALRWLLQKNVEIHFGAFGLLFDDTIVYSQTLPGNDLSRAEFEATVLTVARIADHYDDEIVAMVGGTTAASNGAH